MMLYYDVQFVYRNGHYFTKRIPKECLFLIRERIIFITASGIVSIVKHGVSLVTMLPPGVVVIHRIQRENIY